MAMKKIILFTVFLFLFLQFSIIGAVQGSTYLNGIVLSEINPDSFSVKSPDIPVGLYKVPDPVALASSEAFAKTQMISIFTKIDLFEYNMQAKVEQTLDDLRLHYQEMQSENFYENEKALSAILSLFEQGGKPITFLTKAEPAITVTYKIETSEKGFTRIPERHISFSDELVTHFLLDPLKPIGNERLSPYDIAKVYEISPAFFNTKVEQSKERNKYLDFDGFYVDLPSYIPNEDYRKIIDETLSKLVSEIHAEGKLLIIENLSNQTVELSKYADVIGINYDAGISAIKFARENFQKPIFVTYNGVLSSREDLKSFLNLCLYLGVYPEFRRDTSTGEFFYYENIINKNSSLIKEYLEKIDLANLAGFKGFENSSNLEISKFGSFPFAMFVVYGKGKKELSIDAQELTGKFKIRNLDGKEIEYRLDNGIIKISLDVDGLEYIQVIPNSFATLFGEIAKLPSSSDGFFLKVANVSSSSGSIALEEQFKERNTTLEVDLKTFESRNIFLENGTQNVVINGVNYAVPKVEGAFNPSILIIPFLLIAWIICFLIKKEPGFKMSDNVFALILFSSAILFYVVNRLFLHYAPTTFNFFLFALLFLISAFRGSQFWRKFSAFILMLAMGFTYNYFEFRTMLPVQFSGIPPFSAFESFLYFLPYLFAAVFFITNPPNNVSKSEVFVIFITLLTIVVAQNSLILPYSIFGKFEAFIPVLVFMLFWFIKELLLKQTPFKKIPFYVIIVLIMIFSSYFVKRSLTIAPNEGFFEVLFSRDLSVLLGPFLFFVLSMSQAKVNNPQVSLNRLVYILFALFPVYYFVSQYTIKVKGSPYFSLIGANVIPVILLSLFAILFFENINKQS